MVTGTYECLQEFSISELESEDWIGIFYKRTEEPLYVAVIDSMMGEMKTIEDRYTDQSVTIRRQTRSVQWKYDAIDFQEDHPLASQDITERPSVRPCIFCQTETEQAVIIEQFFNYERRNLHGLCELCESKLCQSITDGISDYRSRFAPIQL
jgi:hypothetical protein